MGDGTEQNPYTHEDVVFRLIKENGDKAEGLDLSKKWFEKGIDLYRLDLKGIILRLAHLEGAKLQFAHLERAYLLDAHLEGANLEVAHLEEANLRRARLEEADLRDTYLESANLGGTHLEGADLSGAHLGSAYLGGAHLQGAILQSAEFSADTGLENVDWGNYILGEERKRWFALAIATYRKLKQWHTNAGMYDTAGKFFFREMTARRKALKWWPNPFNRAFSKLLSMLCGYGEKWERVVFSAAAVISVLTLIFFGFNSVWEWGALWKSLYFSAVSFTALGYGGWVNETWININNNWIKGIGVAEAFLGVFMMALFLVTFTRKMTR